jgi:hypothetical protein
MTALMIQKAMENLDIALPSWNPWTTKSENISFSAHRPGIGDGEDKVAAELDTVPLGQNSPYDLVVTIHGVVRKCDVKKLDKNTFNTGVAGRNALRPIKNKLESLLLCLAPIMKNNIFTEEEQKKLGELEKMSPDELSVGTLRKLTSICKLLHEKLENLRQTLPSVKSIANPYNNTMFEMTAEKYYQLHKIFGIPLPEELQPLEETLQMMYTLEHDYITNPENLTQDLHQLTTLFQDISLIFVDEKKGYYILENPMTKIKFERITRGHPRFRVVF